MNPPPSSRVARWPREQLLQLCSLLASPATKQRFPFAVRTGLCCAIPVVAGWFAGDAAAAQSLNDQASALREVIGRFSLAGRGA